MLRCDVLAVNTNPRGISTLALLPMTLANTLVGGGAASRTASAAIESNGNTNPSLLKKRCRGLGGVKHRIGDGDSIISL